MFRQYLCGGLGDFVELALADFVSLRQHDLIRDGGRIEQPQDLIVDALQPVACINEHEHAQQRAPPRQIAAQDRVPRRDLILGRFCEAVARHVDEVDARLADGRREEVEFLCAPRCIRGARQLTLADER